eukprot:3250292-Amphidinium_carterae.1
MDNDISQNLIAKALNIMCEVHKWARTHGTDKAIQTCISSTKAVRTEVCRLQDKAILIPARGNKQ